MWTLVIPGPALYVDSGALGGLCQVYSGPRVELGSNILTPDGAFNLYLNTFRDFAIYQISSGSALIFLIWANLVVFFEPSNVAFSVKKGHIYALPPRQVGSVPPGF